MELLLQLLLLIVGFAMLMKGADWFVDGASKIADKFGIPHLIIGLTIVAFGTSAPEAAVSISAAMKGNVDLSISNVLGSNIMNVLLILGLASLIYPLAVKKSTLAFDIPFVFAISVLMLILGMADKQIGRVDGLIFWALLIAYIVYMIKMAKKGKEELDDEFEPAGEQDKMWKLILLLVVGGVMIVWGSDITVDAASAIAMALGMSERMVGLTIVAFGTSLPELVTSCIAAKKKETDIAVGNIVGSNLFNILFVLGTTAVIKSVAYTSVFILDNVMAILVVVILWLVAIKDKKIKRSGGVIMLVTYAIYFAHLLMQQIG